MTDIDPSSIPVLDDVIEDDSKDRHAALADETPVVENDDLFSPASLLDEDISQAEHDIDHAANIAALEGNMEDSREDSREHRREHRHIAADQGEDDIAVHQSDEDTDIQPVSDGIDHIDAITALDESTPPGGDDLYQDDILNDQMVAPVVDSATGPDNGIAENTPADTVQASSSQQSGINTAALTNQIIDRLMPEIEQRLRVIIDLTLRENLRDRNPEE